MQTEEQDVILNADSSAVFRQLVMLRRLDFDAIETSSVINANDVQWVYKIKELVFDKILYKKHRRKICSEIV
ncbi:MAG: hypothetical protein V8S14_03505 [Lachnospiraceae bacterium]